MNASLAVNVATRLAALAQAHGASAMRFAGSREAFGTVTYLGARATATATQDLDLAGDLSMLMSEIAAEGGPARLDVPGNASVQAVRVERDGIDLKATILPRTLFDAPIRGPRAA